MLYHVIQTVLAIYECYTVNNIIGGTLLDVLSSSTQTSLSAETVCKLFYQANLAVKHLHQQKPPIIHRDLKVNY